MAGGRAAGAGGTVLLCALLAAAGPWSGARADDGSLPVAGGTDQTRVNAALKAGAAALAERAQEAKKEAETGKVFGRDWEDWSAGNSVSDIESLQRGARDFAAYCRGCHSLKYVRYSRLAQDLRIPAADLQQYLLPDGAKPADYVSSPMPAADAEAWFGKAPPDLSLMARERGTDYLFQFLTTFYVDPTRPTGANNLSLPNAAMPDVLSVLEGAKAAVFRTVKVPGGPDEQVFDHFVQLAPGSLSREEYRSFVRDLVNFLDYVGEPAQVHRRALGVWVVLFLLLFTVLAYLLKREYWKDVH
ncbi:MAG TPA: cytochrome c1 [Steroidobacteraceae bacterium]|nr:cytochrome c1 [Steroidobacteraceae bacterium]